MRLPFSLWKSFYSALGRLRWSRRQRRAAQARRSTQRRHSIDALEPRVVLNADAVDDELFADYETALDFSVDDLTTNDTDAAELIGYDATTSGGGTLTLTDGTFYYEPAGGFYGADTFTYTIRDEEYNESTAQVTIYVAEPEQPPAGEAPEEPGAPTAQTGRQTSTTIDLDWTAVTPGAQYEIRYHLYSWMDPGANGSNPASAEGPNSFAGVITDADAATATIEGLDPDTDYGFWIRAIRDGMASDWVWANSEMTSEGEPQEPEEPAVPESPSSPTAQTGRQTSTSIELDWTAVTPGASYEIRFHLFNGTDPDANGENPASAEGPNSFAGVVTDADAETAVVEGLDPGTDYGFWIRAVLDDQYGEWIWAGSEMTDAEEEPEEPSEPGTIAPPMSATAQTGRHTSTTIELDWTIAVPGAHYEIRYHLYTWSDPNANGSSPSSAVGPNSFAGAITGANETTAVIEGLSADTDYGFWIRSVLDDQYSDWVWADSEMTRAEEEPEEPEDPGEPGEPPTLSIDGPATVDETAGTVTFTVTLSAASDSPVAVNYTTRTGAAGATDFGAQSGTLLFEPGETSLTITIDLVDDDEAEDDETFYVDLSYPSGAVLAVATAATTITANDVNQAPSFTKGADVATLNNGVPVVIAGWAKDVVAGPTSEAGQSLSFQIVVDRPELFTTAGRPQLVFNSTTGDYDLHFTTSSTAAGVATLTVTLVDDGGTALGGVDASAPQTLVIATSPFAEVAGGGGSGGVPSSPRVGLLTTTTSLTEGEAGQVTLTVMLSRAVDHDVSVNWFTGYGVERALSVYQSAGGALTFAAGQVAKTITVNLIDDARERGDVGFYVALADALGAEIAPTHHTTNVNIAENDVTLTAYGIDGAEGYRSNGDPNVVRFQLTLSRPSDQPITVDYTIGGSGAADLLSASGGSVTFAAGQTQKTIELAVKNDDAWTAHPLNGDIRVGEVTRSVFLSLTSSSPQVMIETPSAVANLYDDDWQRQELVDGEEEVPVLQWFDPYDYSEGDVIHVPVELNGFATFTVPENWEGADFWVYELQPVSYYEWVSSEANGDFQAQVDLVRLDNGDIRENGTVKAKFRIGVSNIDGPTGSGQPVTVSYKTHGTTAEAGVDFADVSGSITFDHDGYIDIEVDIPADEKPEGLEAFFFVITNILGATINTAHMLAVDITADPNVVKMEFKQIKDAQNRELGQLVTGIQRYDFFPDQRLDAQGNVIPGATNVVRVYAQVHNMQVGDIVYFAAFDVDDPSQNGTTLDNDPDITNRKGNDNLGTLDPNNPHVPGAVQGPNDGGFSGLLRSLPNSGLMETWQAASANHKYTVATAKVKESGGIYYAEVELAVSFQPGDNFRVVAMPERDKTDTGTTVPQYVYDQLDDLKFADEFAPSRALSDTQMGTTPILTVWRKLHIEIDGMLDDPSLGDRYDTWNGQQAGLGVIAVPTLIPQTADRYTITVGTDAAIGANALEGGWIAIRTGQGVAYYRIATNDASTAVNGKYETVVRFVSANNPWQAGSTVDAVYEDDFEVVGTAGNQTIQRRISLADTRDPNSALRQALIKYAQTSTDETKNLLAKSFILPVYDLAGGSHLAAQNHLAEENIDDGFNNAGRMNDLYWVSYVALAYQRGGTSSNDPLNLDMDADRWIDGQDQWQPGVTSAYEKFSAAALTPVYYAQIGGQPQEVRHNWSAIYLEQLVDVLAADQEAGVSKIGTNMLEHLARVFIHEIGHQLQLDHLTVIDPNNPHLIVDDEQTLNGIMTVDPAIVPGADFKFTPEHWLLMRRMLRPDSPTPELPTMP